MQPLAWSTRGFTSVENCSRTHWPQHEGVAQKDALDAADADGLSVKSLGNVVEIYRYFALCSFEYFERDIYKIRTPVELY